MICLTCLWRSSNTTAAVVASASVVCSYTYYVPPFFHACSFWACVIPPRAVYYMPEIVRRPESITGAIRFSLTRWDAFVYPTCRIDAPSRNSCVRAGTSGYTHHALVMTTRRVVIPPDFLIENTLYCHLLQYIYALHAAVAGRGGFL